jgi:predicted cobalt transporter CbtA
VFLPINTPEDKLFATNMISPQWVWWVAHVVLGTTAGLVYLLFAQRRLAAVPSLHHVREPHVHRVA